MWYALRRARLARKDALDVRSANFLTLEIVRCAPTFEPLPIYARPESDPERYESSTLI